MIVSLNILNKDASERSLVSKVEVRVLMIDDL